MVAGCVALPVRQTVIPLWADDLAFDPALTSVIYGLAGGIDMLLFYLAGKVMDHKGRRWAVVPSRVIMGAGLPAVPWTRDATSLLVAAMAIGFGDGIGSGMMMTLGANDSPCHGRAHFLGAWRLKSDVGDTCGPGMLSLLAATTTLPIGIAVTGVLALFAAGQLLYWIPRVEGARGTTDVDRAGRVAIAQIVDCGGQEDSGWHNLQKSRVHAAKTSTEKFLLQREVLSCMALCAIDSAKRKQPTGEFRGHFRGDIRGDIRGPGCIGAGSRRLRQFGIGARCQTTQIRDAVVARVGQSQCLSFFGGRY